MHVNDKSMHMCDWVCTCVCACLCVYICVFLFVHMFFLVYLCVREDTFDRVPCTGSSRELETTVFDPASVFLNTH